MRREAMAGIQRADDLMEGRLLMRARRQDDIANATQQLAKRGSPDRFVRNA